MGQSSHLSAGEVRLKMKKGHLASIYPGLLQYLLLPLGHSVVSALVTWGLQSCSRGKPEGEQVWV